MFTRRSPARGPASAPGPRRLGACGSRWSPSPSIPAVDGTTTTVKAVADRLVDTGHDVLLVAPGPGLTTYRGCRVARIQPARAASAPQVREALAGVRARPRPRHLARHASAARPSSTPRRLGVPDARRASSRPSPTVAADYWRAKVGRPRRPRARDRRLDARPARRPRRRAAAALAARRRRRGLRPAAARPPGCTRRWSRARSRGGPRVVVGYVGGLRKRHGVRRLAELGRGPRHPAGRRRRRPAARAGSPTGCPTRSSPARSGPAT